MNKTWVAFFPIIAVLSLVPVLAHANAGDFSGGVAIGSSYAGINAAPTNGLLVQGNVGIGTSSPVGILSVVGSDSNFDNTVTLNLPPSASYGPSITLDATNSTGGNKWEITSTGASNTGGAGGFRILNYDTSASIWMSSSGEVGINNIFPTYTLEVNGSVAGTSAYVNLSDKRHKKNIEAMSEGLEEVEQLKPVSFEWKDPKDDGMHGKQMGFIAQDVEKVLPSVVLTENNDEKTKGIKYSELIPVLTKAIQEIKALLDEDHKAKIELQETVATQQHEIDLLKQTVARLTQQQPASGN